MSIFSPMMMFFIVFPFLSAIVFGIFGTLIFKKHSLWSMPLTVFLILLLFIYTAGSGDSQLISWLIIFPLITFICGAITWLIYKLIPE
ncbi:hypothetical protein [Bacillus atrophaeus]|uniref:hypothetical protein n=1 Tax=Bacillus atrophaeus TaxID=1452 RepID=UPI0022808CF4|nr:hypothetical protein [Bacillus atrophaeus]MCY8920779.1 hypothetical protein [Bacillus atrophaeus]